MKKTFNISVPKWHFSLLDSSEQISTLYVIIFIKKYIFPSILFIRIWYRVDICTPSKWKRYFPQVTSVIVKSFSSYFLNPLHAVIMYRISTDISSFSKLSNRFQAEMAVVTYMHVDRGSASSGSWRAITFIGLTGVVCKWPPRNAAHQLQRGMLFQCYTVSPGLTSRHIAGIYYYQRSSPMSTWERNSYG